MKTRLMKLKIQIRFKIRRIPCIIILLKWAKVQLNLKAFNENGYKKQAVKYPNAKYKI